MNAKRILCPIDFSDHSNAALSYASALARDAGATLYLVHVDTRHIPYDAGFAGFIPPPEDTERLEDALKDKRPTLEGVDYEHHLLFGMPTEALIDFSKSHDIDLVVMGTHGRTGVARLVMGSVAEGVVRRSECPVLTVKDPTAIREKATIEPVGRTQAS